MLPKRVQIVEVGPRDGLQNEPAHVATAEKVAFVNRLSEAGHSAIEVGAFVSSRWVPQMADSAEVFAHITRREGVRYLALVPNLTGLRRAQAANAADVAIFAAASQTFSQRNLNQSISESMAGYALVCEEATGAGMNVRAYLSTSFGCPFEGTVPPETVADLAARLVDMGVYEVALSDTIGGAHPGQISEVVGAVARRIPVERIALHLHDTRGTALVNVYAGLLAGVTTYDSSAGGLGGCPFAPGAAGNLATEDLLYMLDGLSIETGVGLSGVVDASRGMEPHVGHQLPSRVFRASVATPA
jgi:isopropylmalate/homocitrate/citramalate synthase